MIRNVTTKSGTTVEPEAGKETDYNDACDLVASAGWKRYFTTRVRERRNDLVQELVALSSRDAIDFKAIQAKIEIIDDILRIPEIDIRNLRKATQ